MGPIEWLLVVEGIVLVVAGICGSTAYFSRPTNQDPDAFLRAMMGFWRTVAAKRLVLDPVGPARVADADDDDNLSDDDAPIASRGKPAAGGEIDEQSAINALARAADADSSARKQTAASPVLKGGAPPASVAVCTFNVTVVPKSAANDILGRDDAGLRIGVSGAADDALANKLVLAIVARELSVKPYQVTLTRGHFQAAKAVRIAGLSQDALERMLRRYPAV